MLGITHASVRDDIEDALEEHTTSADISQQERLMLKNVLSLHDLRVEDVMIPRADIIALPAEISLADALSAFRTAGHSRFPVYGDTLDDPRGMVHIRDFIDFLASKAESGVRRKRRGKAAVAEAAPEEPARRPAFGMLDFSVPLSSAKILRPVLFVPPSMPALDLLVKMQATRTHMALVIDEYGGTDGLVSIEDIVEMIVGDIEDEHDEAETLNVHAAPDGSFVVDARGSLEDVSKAVGTDLTSMADAEEVDTLGGLVTSLAGRVPVRGEIVAAKDGLEFEIVDADPRRLKRIRIHPPGSANAAVQARRARRRNDETPADQPAEDAGNPAEGKDISG
ncbi:hemolysin family protein [Methylovirgula sp. 4M-Z18]|uniref:hemolysin family protein n=1 Tax=Methylovirgula sp. 4M-Z18 TaxID=2293567 RepID=UPI001FDFB47D|nr:hemolysin family protein [Methylovirgula sp. 4M-Z18]